jgi:multicomponent Na+:H+ antiporter subunit D
VTGFEREAAILTTLPLVLPLAGAVTTLLLRRRPRWQWVVTLGSMAATLAASVALFLRVLADGIQVAAIGGWQAPFGIVLVADRFSAVMTLVAAAMGLAVAGYARGDIVRSEAGRGFYPLFHVLLFGVFGALLTGDLFNLFVWFEVMLMASFVLIALSGRREALAGAVPYVTVNLLSSAFFLSAVGLLYAATGTLNLADLSVRFRETGVHGTAVPIALLLFVAFGIKAAVFPLFQWLPASYHAPAFSVSAIFAGLLTKVGVYALIRLFTLVLPLEAGPLRSLVLLVATATMLVGVLGAAAQSEIRRILSFHIVSQIGYMVLGLGIFTRQAIAGAVFYIVHHIVVKTNLFLLGGLVRHERGTTELSRLGGLAESRPAWAVLFLVSALSLAGIPPLSGFFAKLALIRAGLAAGLNEGDVLPTVAAAVALLVGLWTLYSMTKIWNEVFWKAAPPSPSPSASEVTRRAVRSWMVPPVVALAAITVVVGLFAGPVFEFAEATADELLDPSRYVDAVLKKGAP